MIIKNTFLYLVGNIVNRIGAFLLLPVYTAHLSVAEYGILELSYSTISVLSILLGAGLSHTTLRFYFEKEDQAFRNSVITTNAIITTATATFFALIFASNSEVISLLLFDHAKYSQLISLLSAIIVFELVSEIYFAYIRAKQKAMLYVVVSSLKLFTQLVMSIYLVVHLDMAVHGVVIANLICVFVVWLYLTIYTVRSCGFYFNSSILKPVFRYALPFASASLIGVLLVNTDKLMLRYFIGLEALGIYGLAMKFALILSFILLDPIQKSYGPYRFSIMNNGNANIIYSGLTLLIIDLSSLIVLCMIYFVPYIIELMAEPAYWTANYYIPILLFGVMFQAVNYNMQTGILINKKTQYLSIIMVIVTLFNVGLNYLAIPLYGLYAASIVYVLSYILMAGLTYIFSQKQRYITYPFYRMAITIGMLLLFSVVGYFNTSSPEIIKVVLFLLFFIIIYMMNKKEYSRTIKLVSEFS